MGQGPKNVHSSLDLGMHRVGNKKYSVYRDPLHVTWQGKRKNIKVSITLYFSGPAQYLPPVSETTNERGGTIATISGRRQAGRPVAGRSNTWVVVGRQARVWRPDRRRRTPCPRNEGRHKATEPRPSHASHAFSHVLRLLSHSGAFAASRRRCTCNVVAFATPRAVVLSHFLLLRGFVYLAILGSFPRVSEVVSVS